VPTTSISSCDLQVCDGAAEQVVAGKLPECVPDELRQHSEPGHRQVGQRQVQDHEVHPTEPQSTVMLLLLLVVVLLDATGVTVRGWRTAGLHAVLV